MYTDLVSVEELLDMARRGDLNLSGMLLMALDEVLIRAGYSKTNKANPA